jgi:predicted MFS family arabinose efflux permease
MRWGYALSAIISGLAASLGNGLVNVNAANLAGVYGVNVADSGWLLAAYISMAVSANLLLVRARQQFGISFVTSGLLLFYVGAGILSLIFPGFASALLVRALCGLSTAGLTALTVFNMLQVFPANRRPIALMLAFGIPQLGIPLARLFPVELLTAHGGSGLAFIEIGIGLIAFAALHIHPIPPTLHSPAFEWRDARTIALFVPGMVLLCGVLAEGRAYWWTDTPWVGLALAAAIPLLALALLSERNRARPLLVLRWLTTGDVVRFGLVALVLRFSLAEQTFGAVGLLSTENLNNDQTRWLFTAVLIAMICGTAASTWFAKPARLPLAILVSALLIMTGAWLDSQASNLTRPSQLFLSQILIGLGASLFIGPALVFGFIRMAKHGPEAFISFVVVLGMSQNVGSLLGAAVLGSYQTIATRTHLQNLTSQLTSGNPLLQGRSDLPAILARESTILAFNDVFRAVAVLMALMAVFMAYRSIHHYKQTKGST